MELLSQYGLFLAKVVTLVVAIGALVVLTVGMTQRKRHRKGELQVINLGEQYREMRQEMQSAAMSDTARSLLEKKQKKEEKETAKQEKKRAKRGEDKSARPCLYVLDFNGSMDAGEVSSLREEVSAVLAVAGRKMKCCCGWKAPAVWCMATGWRLPSSSVFASAVSA